MGGGCCGKRFCSLAIYCEVEKTRKIDANSSYGGKVANYSFAFVYVDVVDSSGCQHVCRSTARHLGTITNSVDESGLNSTSASIHHRRARMGVLAIPVGLVSPVSTDMCQTIVHVFQASNSRWLHHNPRPTVSGVAHRLTVGIP